MEIEVSKCIIRLYILLSYIFISIFLEPIFVSCKTSQARSIMILINCPRLGTDSFSARNDLILLFVENMG